VPQGIGLSGYSLAANYFLQDPQVGLLAAGDPRARETLALALQHLGDRFDPRIVTWHNAPEISGQGKVVGHARKFQTGASSVHSHGGGDVIDCPANWR
jgi:hypothetical protein